MSKLIIIFIATIFMISCGGEKDVVKKTTNNIIMDEDSSLKINILNYINDELKEINIKDKNENIDIYVIGNEIIIKPKEDVNGNFEIVIEGEDINGKENLLIFNLKINDVNDTPRLTKEKLELKYKDGEKIYSGSVLYDIEKDISLIPYKIIKNNNDIELIIVNNELIFVPKQLGINNEIIYKLEFYDNDEIQTKEIKVSFNYIGEGIPLTENSKLEVKILEDNEYIGEIKPIEKFQGQKFTIKYLTDSTIGSVLSINEFEYKYIPKENYYGDDYFEVIIENSNGEKIKEKVSINIENVIDDFFVSDVSGVILEDNIFETNLTIDDPEFFFNYEIIYNESDVNGFFELKNNILKYTPFQNFNGEINKDLVIKDTINNRTDFFNFKINVVSELDPLVISDKEINVIKGYEYKEIFTFNDPENSKFYYSVIQPNEGNVTINNETGEYIYQSDINGSLSEDNFKIIVLDSINKRTTEANIFVNIIGKINKSISLSVNEDGVLNNIKVPVIKVGDENNFSLSVLSNPTNGNVKINADKTLKYTPIMNYNGMDSFIIRVIDNKTSYFIDLNYVITVIEKSDYIEFEKLNYNPSVIEDGELVIDLTIVDPDKNGTLEYSIEINPENGVLTLNNGIMTYTPDNNFNGEDFVAIRFKKDELNINEVKLFNIHIIEKEDNLYLSENIDLKMYGSSYKEINVKSLVINDDNEDVIFLADELSNNNDWIIQSIYMDAKINRDTGLLKIKIFNNVQKDQIINFPFRIKEKDSGTVWYFNGKITILENLNVVNQISKEELINAPEDSVFLFCSGEFDLGNEEIILNKGVKLYGKNYEFNNVDNVDLISDCLNKSGNSTLITNNSLSVTMDNEISGFNIIKKGSLPVIKENILEEFIRNIKIEKNIFNSETDDIVFYIDNSSKIFDNITIKDNEFIGNNNDVKNLNGIHINENVNSLIIENNKFNYLNNALIIDNLNQESNYSKDLYVGINYNSFENNNYAIRIKEINAISSINQIININENTINDSNIGIKFDKANLPYTYNSNLNINIESNFITNSKNKAITFNDEDKMTGFYNINISLKNNIITVFDGVGIELIETLILNNYIYMYSHKISIDGNEIHPVNNSLVEENSGILFKTDYYNAIEDTKNFNNDNLIFNLNKVLVVDIENNKIGNTQSSFKFNDSAILITRVDNEKNIINSSNHKIIFNINDNEIYGNNDITVDHNKLNENKDNISFNIERNVFGSIYPKYSFKINEKHTNLCLKFIDNNFDFINLINEDVDNSNMIIADPNNSGINLFYDEQQGYGNVIVSDYSFVVKDYCE